MTVRRQVRLAADIAQTCCRSLVSLAGLEMARKGIKYVRGREGRGGKHQSHI